MTWISSLNNLTNLCLKLGTIQNNIYWKSLQKQRSVDYTDLIKKIYFLVLPNTKLNIFEANK